VRGLHNRALLRTLVFTVLVPGTITLPVPYLLLGARAAFEIGPLRFVSVPCIALGAATYFWCAWEFVFAGRGTPAPIDPPKTLVVRGPYRFVRNPMYIAVVLVLGGEAILFQSCNLAAYTALAWLACHLFVVFYEEPTLKKKFGAAYEAYCQAVPRWRPRFTQRNAGVSSPAT